MLGVPSRPINVGYRFIYMVMALFVIVVELPRVRTKRFNVGLLWLSVFWLIYVGRIVYDLFYLGISQGFASRGGIFFLQYGVGGCYLPALAAGLSIAIVKPRALVKWLTAGFVMSCCSCLVYIIYEHGLTIELFYQRVALGEESVISPIILSQTGGGLIILAVGSSLIKPMGPIAYLCTILGLVPMVMGASRGPALVTVVILLLIGWQHFLARYDAAKFWGAFLMTVVLFAVAWFKFILPNLEEFTFLSRITDTINEGQGLSDRSMQWESAWNQFLQNPVLGDKIIENYYSFYPHNLVLEVLMATGIVGFFCFMLFLLHGLLKYFNRTSYDAAWRPVMLLGLGFFGYSIVSSALITLVQFWVLFGAMCGLQRVVPLRDSIYDHV